MNNSEPKIIFEDESLLVLNKPYGMIVNMADTSRHEFTLEEWLSKNFSIPADRNGIVHRLDKDTSGVILVAKNQPSLENLQSQFKNREVSKTYLALVHGNTPQDGIINAPIERNPFNRMRFGVFPGGREAITTYVVISNFKFQISNYSLLEVTPYTGRTHQIRVHLKYIGHPIVSDILYSGRKNYRDDQKIFPRMFLHAKNIELNHPKTNKRVKYEAELPKELQDILNLMVSLRGA